MNPNLLSVYGLKWNPFSPALPTEAIYIPARIEEFCWRIEQVQVREGGFAMIHGDPGSGKSVVLRLLAQRLSPPCRVVRGRHQSSQQQPGRLLPRDGRCVHRAAAPA